MTSRVRFAELIEQHIGGGWGSEVPDADYSEAAYVIRGTDIPRAAVGDVAAVPLRYHKVSNLRSRQLQAGDIVFEVSGGSKGQPVGRALFITQSLLAKFDAPVMCASFCKLIRIDPNRCEPAFAHRRLQLAYVNGEIETFEVQSTGITNFKWGPFLDAFEFELPSTQAQSAAMSVLAALDAFVWNNRRRIEILEEMARTIYREWFVDFRYPGHQAIRLIDSDLGLIPEGWRLAPLGEVLSVLESGKRPKGGIDPTLDEGVPSIGAENIRGYGMHDYSSERYISNEFYESMTRGKIESGDVLLYKDGAHIGRHSMARDGFPHERCAINEHVFRMRALPPLTQNFLYFWVDDPATVQRIVDLNSNAAQPGVSSKKLRTLLTPVPSKRVVDEWDRLVDPLVRLIARLAKKIRLLREARDLLLPRLVSGEIDLSELALPEAV